MATYSKLPSGTWRVQERPKGRYIGETLLKCDGARRWRPGAEGRMNRPLLERPMRTIAPSRPYSNQVIKITINHPAERKLKTSGNFIYTNK